MAKKIDYTLDDFGFDKEFDDLDFDFDVKPVKDDRNPATKVVTGFASGVKSTVTSESFIRDSIKNILPRGYGTAFDAVTDSRDTIRDLYNSSAEELRPVVNDLKRLTSKVVPTHSRYIPGGLAKFLERWSQNRETESRRYTYQDNDEAEISRTMAELFKVQSIEQDKKDQEREIKDQLREGLAYTKHREEISQLNQIRLSLTQLTSYQDRITANYQRKSLELQYRQFFVARDALIEQKRFNAESKAYFESINKNTALPDYVKLKQSERLGEAMRNRFINDAIEGVLGQRTEFIRNVGGRLSQSFLNNLRQTTSGLRAGMSSMDMAGDMGGMGLDPYSMGGEVAGSLAASYLSGARIGNRLRGYVDRNRTITTRGNQLQYHLQNLPQYAHQFARSSTGSFGLASFLVNPLKDAILAGGPSRHVDMDNIKNLQEPGVFTRQTNKSINEVIPGLLSRIHHELQIIRTGDASIEPITYDFVRNKFNVDSVTKSNLVASVINPAQKEYVKRNIDELIDTIDPDKTLSDEARKALGSQLLIDNMNNRLASPDRLSNESIYRGEAQQFARQYSNLFKNYFSEDSDYSKRAGFSSMYNDLGRFINIDRSQMQSIVNAGQASALADAGILSLGGPDARDPSGYIDFAKYFNYYYNDTYNPSGSVSPSNVNPLQGILRDPVRNTDLDGGMYLKDNVEQSRRIPSSNESKIIEAIHSISPLQLITISNNLLESIDTRLSAGLPTYVAGTIAPEEIQDAFASETTLTKDKKTSFFRRVLKGAYKGSLWSSKYTTGILTEAGANFKRVLQGVGNLADIAIGRGRELTDVFIGENPQPVLEAWKLKAGHYKDELTGKVISKFSDIKGNVLDEEGNVALKAEDLKRAYSRTRSGVKSLYTLGVNKSNSLLKEGIRRFRAMDLTRTGLFSLVRDRALDKASAIHDIYVKGKEDPILQDWKLKAGHYRDSVTGQVIKSFNDIKNPIMEDGRIVATLEDLKEAYTKTASGFKPFQFANRAIGTASRTLMALSRHTNKSLGILGGVLSKGARGLFGRGESQEGEEGTDNKSPFEKGLSGVLGLGGKGIGLLGRSAQFLGQGLNEGISNFVGLFSHALRPVFRGRSIENRLVDIYELLDERMPGRKIRKGSYEDQVKQRETEEREASITDRVSNRLGGSWSNSIYGMGAGALGGLYNRFRKNREGGAAEDGDSTLTDVATGAAAGSLAGRAWDATKRFGKWAGKGLWKHSGALAVGAGAYGMSQDGFNWGDAAMMAGGLAASPWGRAALLGLGKGALVVGGGLIAAVGAPVVIGVSALAAGGYLGYRYLTRKKPELVSSIRYAQYGFLPGDDDRFRKILAFEETLSKCVNYSGNTAKIDINKFNNNIKTIAETFDIDLKNEGQMVRWGEWFVKRFRPVFLKHLGVLKQIGSEVSLADVDDKLSTEEKIKYIKDTAASGDIYEVMVSPFPADQSLQAGSTHVDELTSVAMAELNKNKKAEGDDSEGFFSSMGKKIGEIGASMLGISTAKAATLPSSESGDPTQDTSLRAETDSGFSFGNPFKGLTTGMAVATTSLLSTTEPKIGEITKLRMMQYGLNPNDTELVKRVVAVDNKLAKLLTEVNGRAKIDINSTELAKEVYGAFGINSNRSYAITNFQWWFGRRYTQVLAQHVKALKKLNKTLDFTYLDSTLSKNDKVEYLQLAAADWMSYERCKSPFKMGSYIEDNKVEIDTYKESIINTLKSVGAEDKSELPTEMGFLAKTKGFLGSLKDRFFGSKSEGEVPQTTTPSSSSAVPPTPSVPSSINPNAAMSTVGAVASANARGGLIGSLESPTLGAESIARTRPLKGDGAANRKLMVSIAQSMGITDPKELAMFLAQLDHESAGFTALEENLNYSSSNLLRVFGKYFKTREQAEKAAAAGPQAIASIVYGNRMGNNGTGEGWTYRGRGFIQLTGKDNYKRAGEALGIDLVNNPDLASTPEVAAKIAVWYWQDRRGLSSAGKSGDVRTATKLINGGYNGLADRERLYKQYVNMNMSELAPEATKTDSEEVGATGSSPTIDPAKIAGRINPMLGDGQPTAETKDAITPSAGGYAASAAATSTPVVPSAENSAVPTAPAAVERPTFNGFNPNTAISAREVAAQQKQNAVDNNAMFTPIHDSMKESVLIGREHLGVSKEMLKVLMTIAELTANKNKQEVDAKSNPNSGSSSPTVSSVSRSPVSLAKKYA